MYLVQAITKYCWHISTTNKATTKKKTNSRQYFLYCERSKLNAISPSAPERLFCLLDETWGVRVSPLRCDGSSCSGIYETNVSNFTFHLIITSLLSQRNRRLTPVPALVINADLVPHKSKFKVVLNYSSDAVSLFDSPLCGTRCAETSAGPAHASACTSQWVSPDLRAEYIKYLAAVDYFSLTHTVV